MLRSRKTELIRNNPYLLLAIIFLIVLSIAAGVSTYISVYDKFNEMSYNSVPSIVQINLKFEHFVLLNESVYLMICMPGIWIPGILPQVLGFVIKGFLNGFAAGAVVSSIGFVSIPVLFFALIIPETIILLILVRTGVLAIREWGTRARDFAAGKQGIQVSQPYIKFILITNILIVLAVLFQVLISSVAFRLIS